MASVKFFLALTMFVNFLAALDAVIILTCPSDFTLVGDDCYLVTPEAGSRLVGVKYCKAINAGPAAIYSQEQMDDVAGILSVSVYLGVNDIVEEGIFVNPGGEVANYTNFITGEPNNNRNEDCVAAKDNKDYRWNDVDCSKSFNTLCQVSATVVDIPEYICQNGDKFDDSTCFLASGLELPAANYNEAIAYCHSKSMHLASIHSQTEDEFLHELIDGITWIGLNKGDEGNFSWIDGTPVDYLNWNAGEPNNLGGHENCVQMSLAVPWNDEACHWYFPVLCRGSTTVV